MSVKRAYVVNPEAIDMISGGLADDDSLTGVIRAAFRRFLLRGGLPGIIVRDEENVLDTHKAAHRHAVAIGMLPVFIDPNDTLIRNAFAMVLEWAAEVKVRSPSVYSAILNRKVSFKMMLGRAKRWRRAKEKQERRLELELLSFLESFDQEEFTCPCCGADRDEWRNL
jgi:hypothetical protein